MRWVRASWLFPHIGFVLAGLTIAFAARPAWSELKTWDGQHDVDRIEVTVAYFLPRDRTALPDWRERVDYFCRRIEKFHQREFQGQSTLTTKVHPEPFRSTRTTPQLRAGDGNFIFFQTLREVDRTLKFGQGERTAFPILLVLSDVNWRPLDDFYRVKPTENGYAFEGIFDQGRHHPGAESGGARATYLADRGVGWGLVSADGWRVPYAGSDCVVYHEGVGHTIGLPHPEPGNDSVMSFGQYRGWISQSWLDDEQKRRLGWTPPKAPADRKRDLFSVFQAWLDPLVPEPGQDVALRCEWPQGAEIRSCRVRVQTDVFGPWLDVANVAAGPTPATLRLGRFDRPTPVSFRVDVELADGQTEELWGYFQVRAQPDMLPLPVVHAESPPALRDHAPAVGDEVDLLAMIDEQRDRVAGEWRRQEGRIESPKQYGARLEIPYQPPEEYQLTVVAEPLDDANGLILGQRSGANRFLVLVNYAAGEKPLSALENVDGRNVGGNETTVPGVFLKKGRISQVVCTVRKDSVRMQVDGREIINWQGKPEQLSLSDYWQTPRENALFLGAYDCRYRFYRVTLAPLSGEGVRLTPEAGE